MSYPSVAVTGSGFSGTLLSLQLLRRTPPSTHVFLLEREGSFGLGQAYSTKNSNHLLNVPAGKMSAFSDRPLDFLQWLRNQEGEVAQTNSTETTFAPRRLFGCYMQDLRAGACRYRREIQRNPAAQTLLAELGVAEGAIVTLDALHCQKNEAGKID